jgi:hypothetical protein
LCSARTGTSGSLEAETLELGQRHIDALKEQAIGAACGVVIDISAVPWAIVLAHVAWGHARVMHGVDTGIDRCHMGHGVVHSLEVGRASLLVDDGRAGGRHCFQVPKASSNDAYAIQDDRFCILNCSLRLRFFCAHFPEASASVVEP